MIYRFTYTVFLAVCLIAWTSCSGSKTVSSDSGQTHEPALAVDYTVIYMIHGDGGYLYHNENGEAKQADDEVFKEAVSLAQEVRHGEVFIYHLNAERKILGLFPKKDREFLYFRSGRLVNRQKYSPVDSEIPFKAETELFHQFKPDPAADQKNIFLYFGHEIPRNRYSGYHSSRPSVPFNINTFARGLHTFLAPDRKQFDLTVLSTCNNGTPDMAAKLLPYTRYLLASPQNLHLSHVDTNSLVQLDHTSEIEIHDLAQTLAEQTFNRLKGFIQTGVSLSLYNMNEIRGYLNDMVSEYNRYLESNMDLYSNLKNTDCKSLPFFDKSQYESGVQVWYTAPRFGENSDMTTHSGWGCR